MFLKPSAVLTLLGIAGFGIHKTSEMSTINGRLIDKKRAIEYYPQSDRYS